MTPTGLPGRPDDVVMGAGAIAVIAADLCARARARARRDGPAPEAGTRRAPAARPCALDRAHAHPPDWSSRPMRSDRAGPTGRPRPAIPWRASDPIRRSAAHGADGADTCRDPVDARGAELVSVGDGSDGRTTDSHIMSGTIMGDDPGNSMAQAGTCLHEGQTLGLASSPFPASAAGVTSTRTTGARAPRMADRAEARPGEGR